jgi:hypothetical protein
MEQIGFNKSISRLKGMKYFIWIVSVSRQLEENHVVDVSPHCRCQETRRRGSASLPDHHGRHRHLIPGPS